MVFTEGPSEGLRQVERSRGYVWANHFTNWTWYAGMVLLVSFGVVRDLAPDWAGIYFFVMGLVALLIGMSGWSRRGRALLRLPALPRSAVLGTGHRGTTRSKVLLATVWTVALGCAVLLGAPLSRDWSGDQSDPPVPYTVLYLLLAMVLAGIGLIGRHWAHPKISGPDRQRGGATGVR